MTAGSDRMIMVMTVTTTVQCAVNPLITYIYSSRTLTALVISVLFCIYPNIFYHTGYYLNI